MITDDISAAATDTMQSAQHLAELNIEKLKLDLAEGLSTISVKAISIIVKLVIICNIVFFLSMGVALIIADLTGIQCLGFFVIGALFGIVLIIYKTMRKSLIESPIVKTYIDLIFNQKS